MGIHKRRRTDCYNWKGHFVGQETEALNDSDLPKVTCRRTRPRTQVSWFLAPCSYGRTSHSKHNKWRLRHPLITGNQCWWLLHLPLQEPGPRAMWGSLLWFGESISYAKLGFRHFLQTSQGLCEAIASNLVLFLRFPSPASHIPLVSSKALLHTWSRAMTNLPLVHVHFQMKKKCLNDVYAHINIYTCWIDAGLEMQRKSLNRLRYPELD